MEKIDRLDWAAGLALVAQGLRIGVRTDTPELLQLATERLPPGYRPLRSPLVQRLYSLVAGGPGPSSGVRRYSLLYEGALRLARTLDLDQALEALESDMYLFIAEHARHRTFVHAGVVGWNGRAVLIPGPTHTGKSTLVAALVRAGATYLSDEYAVLDAGGLVHPFPRPLSLRPTGEEPATRIAAEALGAPVPAQPLPAGLVVATRYRPAARWRPQRLSPGRGMLGLLANAVPARRRPQAVLGTLRQVAASARFFRGVRGEAAEVVSWLLQAAAA